MGSRGANPLRLGVPGYSLRGKQRLTPRYQLHGDMRQTCLPAAYGHQSPERDSGCLPCLSSGHHRSPATHTCITLWPLRDTLFHPYGIISLSAMQWDPPTCDELGVVGPGRLPPPALSCGARLLTLAASPNLLGRGLPPLRSCAALPISPLTVAPGYRQ